MVGGTSMVGVGLTSVAHCASKQQHQGRMCPLLPIRLSFRLGGSCAFMSFRSSSQFMPIWTGQRTNSIHALRNALYGLVTRLSVLCLPLCWGGSVPPTQPWRVYCMACSLRPYQGRLAAMARCSYRRYIPRLHQGFLQVYLHIFSNASMCPNPRSAHPHYVHCLPHPQLHVRSLHWAEPAYSDCLVFHSGCVRRSCAVCKFLKGKRHETSTASGFRPKAGKDKARDKT
jgi:hypothetical protein